MYLINIAYTKDQFNQKDKSNSQQEMFRCVACLPGYKKVGTFFIEKCEVITNCQMSV